MIRSAKCPKCDTSVRTLEIEEVTVEDHRNSSLLISVAFVCPFCHSILGVQLDPVGLKHDLADEIVERLRKRK